MIKSSVKVENTFSRKIDEISMKCACCKYEYSVRDVYTIPRLRKVVSRIRNGNEIATQEMIKEAEEFYVTHGYLEANSRKYVKLVGKSRDGAPIFLRREKLLESDETFNPYEVIKAGSRKKDVFRVCPKCGCIFHAETLVKTRSYDETMEEALLNEKLYVPIPV